MARHSTATGQSVLSNLVSLFLLVVVSALFCATIIVLSRPLFIRFDHIDHPGGRKRHLSGTPLSGGIAIITTVWVVGGLSAWSFEFAGFIFGMSILAILGLIDDRRHVPAVIRLGGQTLAVAIGMCALAALKLETLGSLFTPHALDLGGWSVAFTVFASVGIINAINMIDGVDGIAGGFSLLLLVVIFLVAAPASAVDCRILSVVIGGLIGFLFFNLRAPWRKKARIFLGDAGSLMLGYALVWFVVDASQGVRTAIAPVTAVWLMGLPLCDTTYLMLSRALRGRNPMAADRSHYHHLLLRLGLSPGKACMAWLASAAMFMLFGLTLDYCDVPEYIATYTFMAVFVLFCLVVMRAWQWLLVGRRAKMLRRSKHARR